MKPLYLILFTILFYINYSKAVTVNILGCSFLEAKNIYTPLANEFNKYAEENGIDITVNLDLITDSNSTQDIDDYGSLMETLFRRKSTKYDLYFYDDIYTIRYSSYMLNLKDYLSKEHIDLYSHVINSEAYTYKDRVIGLPVSIDYAVLYSNSYYLKKYNKEIPKTWNELLEIGKYIKEEEAKQNNGDLTIYNGLFPLEEIGTCSIYETIYSFRDKPESPFPELTSQNAIDALIMTKKIKDEISSDGEYKAKEYVFEKLMTGEAVFLKFCYLRKSLINPIYNITEIPGLNKGVSSAVIGGYNLGISKYSNLAKRNEVVEVLKYMTSKEMQRKLVKDFRIISGIQSLYNEEEEICKEDEELCNLYNSIQPISRPVTKTNDYTSYSDKLRNTIYEFIYGNDNNSTALEVLKKVDDITKIYYVSLNSSFGKKLVFSYFGLIIILLLPLICLKYKDDKFEKTFEFLSNDFWILLVTGTILILIISFLDIIKVTSFVCHLKLFLQSISFTLTSVPILYKLIICFPEYNNISEKIRNNKYLFLLAFIFVDIFLNILTFTSPYYVKDIINNNGKNYQVCEVDSSFTSFIRYFLLIFHSLIILTTLFLIFIDWNVEETFYNVRFYLLTIIFDSIILIIFIIIKHLKIKEYSAYFTTRECIFVIFSLSNYFFLFGINIIWTLIKKHEKNHDKYILRRSKDISTTEKSTISSTPYYERGTLVNKLMNYHLRTTPGSSTESINYSNPEIGNYRSALSS
ncbi:periplasmic binding protein-like II [Anaeromyces robustus]|uniref:Periplasmic binding protein-like II n=1 Tax=Anaeromyces robustus TaxID=1754192 RepID=A0A1Y1X569_9FUNG|nr:periplasmic binding protein-like II [Anaeromyces robustus]|eukprot:ORX80961.1 periplasmic binding protein-like II [Anaeromyces robustus]